MANSSKTNGFSNEKRPKVSNDVSISNYTAQLELSALPFVATPRMFTSHP